MQPPQPTATSIARFIPGPALNATLHVFDGHMTVSSTIYPANDSKTPMAEFAA